MDTNKRKPLIAIVDDDVSVRESMKRLASSCGIDAATFASGREFITMLETVPWFKPECVILDVEMQRMNGLAVQRYLNSREPRIPVIFVTASEDPVIHENALALGAVAVLRKPVAGDVLILALHDLFK
jgi:FixJ family two-component response regulator